jgi:hypothetical protein
MWSRASRSKALGFALGLAAAAAACGGESATRPPTGSGAGGARDAGTTGGSGGATGAGGSDAGGATGGAGGTGGSPEVDAGATDGPGAEARDAAGLDAPAMDAPPTDGSGTDGSDGGSDGGTFVRVWTFDNPSAGVDGWVYAFGLASSTIMYDPAVGMPNPGSLVLGIPFGSSAGGEQLAINAVQVADLTHRHVSALFRLESGGPVQASVGYSSTGNYVLVHSPSASLTAGSWTMLTLDVDNPAAGSFIDTSHHDADGGIIPPTPTDTRVIVVDVNTPFSAGTYTPAVVHVDLVGYY